MVGGAALLSLSSLLPGFIGFARWIFAALHSQDTIEQSQRQPAEQNPFIRAGGRYKAARSVWPQRVIPARAPALVPKAGAIPPRLERLLPLRPLEATARPAW